MKLSIQQELAINEPYRPADAKRLEEAGPSVHHMSHRWISSEVQVLIVFTVNILAPARPFWHVSLSVKVRDVGTMPVAFLEIVARRRLRDIGQDVLKGIGYPADEDKWEVGDKALHLMRSLTDEEIALLPEAPHG